MRLIVAGVATLVVPVMLAAQAQQGTALSPNQQLAHDIYKQLVEIIPSAARPSPQTPSRSESSMPAFPRATSFKAVRSRRKATSSFAIMDRARESR